MTLRDSPRLAAALCGMLLWSSVAAQSEIEGELGAGAPRTSLREIEEQVRAQPPATSDPQELSVFHHRRGVAFNRLGNYTRAIEDLQLALARSQTNRLAYDGWGDRWRIQVDLGNAMNGRGLWFQVIDHWNGASQEYRGQNLFRYHVSQLQLARAHSTLAQWTEASAALKEANETLPKLRNTKGWPQWGAGQLSFNAAINAQFLEWQGRHAEAERRRRAALDDAQKQFETLRRTLQPDNQYVRESGRTIGWAKTNLANNLASQGRYGEAEYYARSGLEDRLSEFGISTNPVSQSLAVVGWTRFQQGDLAGAERYYRHALASLVKSGISAHAPALSGRRAALGNVLVAQGRWQDAIKVFDERSEGLRSDAEQIKRLGTFHPSWGLAVLKTGDAKRAAEMAQRMIETHLKRPVQNRWYVAQVRGLHAGAQAALGNTREALALFREAIPELLRREMAEEQSEDGGYWRAFWVRTVLESYLGVLAGMHQAGAGDVIDEAFGIADLARGSGVQEAIGASAARAHIPDAQLAELVRRHQDASNRIGGLNQALGRLALTSEGERLNKVVTDMRTEIERLRKEQAASSAEIRKRFPEYAELTDPRPATLADMRKALVADEALVSIYLAEKEAYVWTVGSGGRAALRTVPVARDEIEADVARLRAATDFGDGVPARLPAFDLARAHKLYRLLLAPDEALWQDAKVLNVIPHGALGHLPFTLLVTAPPASQPGPGLQPGYRDAAWLARRVAVAQLPSANSLTALRRAPEPRGQRRSFIGFGDPIFGSETAAVTRGGLAVRNVTVARAVDSTAERVNAAAQGQRPSEDRPAAPPARTAAFGQLSALPDTADELREIATVLKANPATDVFIGRQANEGAVKRTRLDDRRIVAFATHGITPGELAGLDQPALALANPALSGDADEDGFLTMEEILALRLDADWVVLSACNTGSADGRGGEAVSGLGRAFFYAGARSMLVSNWAVETSSARLLTTELFRRQAENPALTRAEALRQSMLSLMDKSAEGGFSYAHPAFWAPFSLIGDSGARTAR